jgi:alpha-ketoglutaric semialdehyde dehydrogenase
MDLHGRNVIAGEAAASGLAPRHQFVAGGNLATFEEATEEQIHQAARAAAQAALEMRQIPPERRAGFLERIGDEIESLGDDLLRAANAESSRPIRLIPQRRNWPLAPS